MKVIVLIRLIIFSLCFGHCNIKLKAQDIPLGQEKLVHHLNEELSGESAMRNLEFISRLHRMRGSTGYNEATEFLLARLKEYQLESIDIIKIPADGTMYGTQKSRPAWNVDFAELWEMRQEQGAWTNKIKIADWQSVPLVVAQDSHSGEVASELVDVGAGTSLSDYANKEIKGKIVLTSSQPSSIVSLAIEKSGAAGIISYAQNQATAWLGENDNLVRWGHVGTFLKTRTFAFMISLRQARNFQQRLTNGETIRLHAKIKAGQTPGFYNILTGVIKGSDPRLSNEEVAFTCHLDHPRPGANDNASGCVAILEIARALNKLMAEGKISRPKRTIRFIWSPEIEGTTALLNFKPEYASKIRFNIHMDMVGGGPETKAVFKVSKNPYSLPSFIDDIGYAFGTFVNKSSLAYASGSQVSFPVVSKEGGKEALQAVMGEFELGSDHEVYTEGSFRIPSIYLHDWPDRYIHTNYDVPANIDPTKLKRSGFIGAGAGYFIANLANDNVTALLDLMKRQLLTSASAMLQDNQTLPLEEQENSKHYFWLRAAKAYTSLKSFVTISAVDDSQYMSYLANLQKTIGRGEKRKTTFEKASTRYARNPRVKGPMTVFGYDYFEDHFEPTKPKPALLNYAGLKGSGAYAYETLNLVNGENNIMDIRNMLSAQFGPVPIELVANYLEALESIGVINKIP